LWIKPLIQEGGIVLFPSSHSSEGRRRKRRIRNAIPPLLSTHGRGEKRKGRSWARRKVTPALSARMATKATTGKIPGKKGKEKGSLRRLYLIS